MNAKTVFSTPIVRMVGIDILLLVAAYIIPAVSHLFAFPVYYFDPMRIILLTGLLLTANHKNAYVLAVTLPLFSFLVSGHPVFPKNLLIMAELAANVALFVWMGKRMKSVFAAMLFSIICSKILYYALKGLLISTALLDMSFISTGLGYQLLVAVGIAAAFACVSAYKAKRQ